MKSIKLINLILVILFLSACSIQPTTQNIETTRIVQVPITQVITVEVTREVEVTRVVQKEVTRMVTEMPTSTPTPSENDQSVAFSMNFIGSQEKDGIVVELARVIFMQRDFFEPDMSFDDMELFNDQEYIGEIMWRIKNNTDSKITWSYDDVNARINDRQLKLYDYLFYSFGETPMDEIFPGSMIIGGVWFSTSGIKPDEINSVSLLMGPPHDPDTYHSLSGNFVINADLSGEHNWYPLPEELQ